MSQPATSDSPPPSKLLNKYLATIVVSIVVTAIVAGGAGYGLGTLFHPNPVANQPSPAHVSGTVTTTGTNTRPVAIGFLQGQIETPCSDLARSTGIIGAYKTSPIYQGHASGGDEFSLDLLPGVYSVVIAWQGYFDWQGGCVSATPSVTAVSGGSVTQSFSVTTPDSWVNASGTVNVQGNQTVTSPRPTHISFVSNNLFVSASGGYGAPFPTSDRGGRFVAQVYSGNQYNLRVPNFDSYVVEIQWVGSNGGTGTCVFPAPFSFFFVHISVDAGSGNAIYPYSASCNVTDSLGG